MNALSDLELFLNSNSEYLFHVSFIPSLIEIYGENITVIDEIDKFITYKDKEEIHYTIPFSSWIIAQGVKRILKVKNQIDLDLLELSKNNKNPREYLKLLSNQLGVLIKNSSSNIDHINILPFLVNLKERIDQQKNHKDFSLNKDNSVNSYNWFGSDANENLIQLKKLYELLSKNPSIIECSEEEFINGFTNRPVKSGIKWLIKGRGGKISKPSLFYLIDLLIEKELLEEFNNVEYNSKIEYVFRDYNGEPIKNIRQSKSSKTGNPEQGKRIEKIIEELMGIF